MADKHIYVDPDASGSNNGTSWTHAYTDLQAAESAEQADITSIGVYYFHLKSGSGTAEADNVTFDGWTTDSTHYIVLQGGYAAGETGTPGTPENPTSYSTSYWHWEGTDEGFPIKISELYVRMDKLLCSFIQTGTNTVRGIYLTTGTGEVHVSNCILKGTCASTGSNRGVMNYITTSYFYNNIIYDFISGGDTGYDGIYTAVDAKITNCTIEGCYVGINAAAGTVDIYNCAVFNNTDDFAGGGLNTINYCANDDDGDGTNRQDLNENASSEWTNAFTNYGTNDYSVKDASSLLYNNGTDNPLANGMGATDIAGNARSTWDIGAFEYVAAGGVSPTGVLYGPLVGPLGGPI